MAYSYETLGNATADLGRRLYDTNLQFWSSAEAILRVQDALQTWNALTGFWRDSQTFTLSANNTNLWYDLSSVSGTIRSSNTTDNAIIQQIEYDLLEPLTATYPLTWTGSNQYGVADLLNALNEVQNDLLGITGCTLTRTLIAAATNNRSTVQADSVIDIRRVAWLPTAANATFSNTPLRQGADRELQDFQPQYLSNANGTPSNWRISAEVPLTFSVDTLPAVSGNYETLTVSSGPVLNANNSSVLTIPNDWTWVLRMGALAQLFARDGLARDDLRAKYCLQRYQEGLGLLAQAPALLSAVLGNNTLQIDAVRNGDDFSALWQNNSFGSPNTIYTAGLNLIAFSPPANTNATIVAQVVENAPLPANNSDQIQLGRDDLVAVLGYAEHMALLKVGGAEFLATLPLYQDFLKRAALYNSKLSALATAQKNMWESSQWNQEREPVYGQVKPQDLLGRGQ